MKLSLSADAIIAGLCEARPNNTCVAFLCTPTDLHFIPESAYKAALKNYGFHPGKILEVLIQLLSLGTRLKKNAQKPIAADDGSKVYIVDGISVEQGPNYALAKRLQHWRAIVEYENGRTISSNIAPSTSTASVVSNRSFGWAYGGMPYFKPYEIFVQDTTNALMSALLVADVTTGKTAANPANRATFGIKNPLDLFKFNSVHGGLWRAAYTVNSIGEVSVIIHFLGGPKAFLPIVYSVITVLLLLLAKFFLKLF